MMIDIVFIQNEILLIFRNSKFKNQIEEESVKDWEAIIHSFLATSKYDPDEELGIEFQEKRLRRRSHSHHNNEENGDIQIQDEEEGDEDYGVYTEQILDCPF